MTTTLTDAVAPRVATRTRRVFVPLALFAILMAAVGFWPGYFGPVLAAMNIGEAIRFALIVVVNRFRRDRRRMGSVPDERIRCLGPSSARAHLSTRSRDVDVRTDHPAA